MKHSRNRSRSRREGRGHYIFLLLLFFCLFPLCMSGFQKIERNNIEIEYSPGQVWVMEHRFWGKVKIEMEEYLVGMMAATIPAEYEKETLKAQAIILRSFCMSQMKKENGKKIIHDDTIKHYYWNQKQRKELWKEKNNEYEAKIRQAIQETKGIILVSNKEIINPPFFRLSNGSTRDITEYVVQESKYPYMKSIACQGDMMAEDYIQYIEISQKDFEKKLKKLLPKEAQKIRKLTAYKDKNGYVKEIEINGVKIEGEKFRNMLQLASSSFSLQKLDSVIEIQTKGIGHGFGFSQWTANNLAKEGAVYEELLQHFFQNISLEKI